MTEPLDDRRGFFQSALRRGWAELTSRTKERLAPGNPLRPPGALGDLAFLTACTRCGECIDVCPPRAIVPAPGSAGLAAHLPMIDPVRQPCTVCADIPCAAVCPTDALTRPEQGWTAIKMGSLELVPERCVAFDDVTCGVCARACPIGEDAIRLDAGGRPIIIQEGCVGCGVCVQVCVTTPPSLVVHPKG